jgi:rubrerythrin
MSESEERRVGLGQPIYDDDGEQLGTVRGFDEHGFYVTAEEGIQGLSSEHIRAGHELGEAELMWRCWECGEMGRIEADLPDQCPNCGTSKEDLYYWQED